MYVKLVDNRRPARLTQTDLMQQVQAAGSQQTTLTLHFDLQKTEQQVGEVGELEELLLVGLCQGGRGGQSLCFYQFFNYRKILFSLVFPMFSRMFVCFYVFPFDLSHNV